jgi:hypothetical protein
LWFSVAAADTVTVRAVTVYGVGSMQVMATEDAAFASVRAEVPFAGGTGGVAWQLDTTVAETENEAVAVAAQAGVGASTAANKPPANATDTDLMVHLLAHDAVQADGCCPPQWRPNRTRGMASLTISAECARL